MTLGEAILQAQRRGDMDRRNDLIRLAISYGATYRKVARLVGRSVSTVFTAAYGAERICPLDEPLSVFETDGSAA